MSAGTSLLIRMQPSDNSLMRSASGDPVWTAMVLMKAPPKYADWGRTSGLPQRHVISHDEVAITRNARDSTVGDEAVDALQQLRGVILRRRFGMSHAATEVA